MPQFGDYVIDNGLIALSDEAVAIHICSAEPTTYAEVLSLSLGNKTGSAGTLWDAPQAASPSGRKVSSVAITDGAITGAGTVTHWATVDGSNLFARGDLSTSFSVSSGQFTLGSFDAVMPGDDRGDRIRDYGLQALKDECDVIHVCSATPTTYAEVLSLSLGNKNGGAGNMFGAPGAGTPDGRVITSVAISDGAGTSGGTVACWAAVDSVNSRLLATDTLTGGAAITSGEVFTLEAFPVHVPATSGVVAYIPQGVIFDGSNDWLERGAALSGASTSTKKGIVNFWFMISDSGTDGAPMIFVEDNGNVLGIAAVLQVFRLNDNTIRLDFGEAQSGGPYFRAYTSVPFVADSIWHHFLSDWDAATSAGKIYVDGVDVTASPVFSNTALNVAASNDWGIGGRASGSGILKFKGALADLYVAFDQYLGIDTISNRELFRSADGRPVDLGSDGSTPTGSPPDIFCGGSAFEVGHSPADDWSINRGAGGGFTVNGALALAAGAPGAWSTWGAAGPYAIISTTDAQNDTLSVDGSGNWAAARGEKSRQFENVCFEIELVAVTTSGGMLYGLADATTKGPSLNNYLGSFGNSIGNFDVNGASLTGGSNPPVAAGNNISAGWGETVGDVLTVAFDGKYGFHYLALNGTWFNSGDPTSGASGTGAVGHWAGWPVLFPGFSMNSVTGAVKLRTDSGDFVHGLPSGYSGWKNAAFGIDALDPTVAGGNAGQASLDSSLLVFTADGGFPSTGTNRRSIKSYSTGVHTAVMSLVSPINSTDTKAIGLVNPNFVIGSSFLGGDGASYSIGYFNSGAVYYPGVSGFVAWGDGDTVTMEADCDAKQVRFKLNAGSFSSWYDLTGMGFPWFAAIEGEEIGDVITVDLSNW